MADELARILAKQREEECPPTEFDPRALRAVLIALAAFWIAVGCGVAAWFDVSIWATLATAVTGTR